MTGLAKRGMNLAVARTSVEVTIMITGHVLVPGVLWIERAYMPPMWVHMAVWLPLFAIICTLLLRPIKGATMGWMMRLGMTGDEGGAVLRGSKPDA